MHQLIWASLITIATVGTVAASDAGLKNWFDDPFFQVRSGIPQCPKPRGPLLTEAEKIAESHSRIERGTSCWMSGNCTQPNAYLYDQAIGKEIVQRFASSEQFSDSSLWITVKRKFVWVEGCVANPMQSDQLGALVKAVPNVERVFIDVLTDVHGTSPYAVMPTEQTTWTSGAGRVKHQEIR